MEKGGVSDLSEGPAPKSRPVLSPPPPQISLLGEGLSPLRQGPDKGQNQKTEPELCLHHQSRLPEQDLSQAVLQMRLDWLPLYLTTNSQLFFVFLFYLGIHPGVLRSYYCICAQGLLLEGLK